MYFNVNLATAIVPAGTDLQGLGAGHLPGAVPPPDLAGLLVPHPLQRVLDPLQDPARQHGHPGAHGDGRRLDGQARARGDQRFDIRRLYYGILIVFSLWSVIAIRMASPFQLFKFLANMAGIVLAIAGVQIVMVNRRFLPRVLRPALWREIGVLGCSAFYAYFAFYAIRAFFRSL
jgi:hypothetical protein